MYALKLGNGERAVIRVHRQNNHKATIQSECDWINALQQDAVLQTPDIILGLDGQHIQAVKADTNSETLSLVMFAFIEGHEPTESEKILDQFFELGDIAGRMHLHAMHWPKPNNFARGSWNTDTLLGDNPVWGRWQDAPGVQKNMLSELEHLSETVQKRLTSLGMNDSVYGLIHADMRRANLLVHEGNTRLIDFDDCGFSWYLYDFAAAVSFMENHPRIVELKLAWLNGYQQWRTPSSHELMEMDTLIMLRRLALLAWMGSHLEVPIVQALQARFAANTCKLASIYLASH